MRTFDLHEAGRFLRLHPEELRRRVKAGLVPGAKAGKRWVFLDEDLVAYLRSLYPARRQALQVTLRKEVEHCHFADVVQSGGSISSPQLENEYDDLLELTTKA